MSIIFRDILNNAVQGAIEAGVDPEDARYVVIELDDIIIQRIKDVIAAEAERFNVKDVTPQVMWMRFGILAAGRLFDGSYQR